MKKFVHPKRSRGPPACEVAEHKVRMESARISKPVSISKNLSITHVLNGESGRKSLLVTMPGGGTAPIIVTTKGNRVEVNLQRLPALNGELKTANLIRFLRIGKACREGRVKFPSEPFIVVHIPAEYK